MNDPFKDPTELRHYLVLVSATKENASAAQALLRNLQERIDSNASALWVDGKGIGVFVATDRTAWEIQNEMLGKDAAAKAADVRDYLVVEISKDWFARKEAKTEHWLTTHLGSPRPTPAQPARRR